MLERWVRGKVRAPFLPRLRIPLSGCLNQIRDASKWIRPIGCLPATGVNMGSDSNRFPMVTQRRNQKPTRPVFPGPTINGVDFQGIRKHFRKPALRAKKPQYRLHMPLGKFGMRKFSVLEPDIGLSNIMKSGQDTQPGALAGGQIVCIGKFGESSANEGLRKKRFTTCSHIGAVIGKGKKRNDRVGFRIFPELRPAKGLPPSHPCGSAAVGLFG